MHLALRKGSSPLGSLANRPTPPHASLMRPTGRSVRRLQQATDAELQRAAAFQRPAWRATTIHAVALNDWAVARRAQEAVTTKIIVKQIEMLERATLADVRKLIAVFCPDVPASFVFEWVYFQQQVAVTGLTETKVYVGDAELDGVLWLLYPPKTSKHDVQEELAQGFPRDSPETRSREDPMPAFSIKQQLGTIVASIDVFVVRNIGLSLQIHDFRSESGEKFVDIDQSDLTLQMNHKLLAECTGMTESMVHILLSSTRGQTQLLESVLARLGLSTDGTKIVWEWTGNNDVASSDLRVRRRKAHRRPSPPQVPTREKPSDRSMSESLSHQATAPELTSPSVVKGIATKQIAVASEDAILDQQRRSSSQLDKSAGGMSNGSLAVAPTPHAHDTEIHQGSKEHHSAKRKRSGASESVDTLRSCLSIIPRLRSFGYHQTLRQDIVFTELMLREYNAVNLPVFVKKVRSGLRELFGSSSSSQAESIIKVAEMLWDGLSVALWGSQAALFVEHFKSAMVKRLEETQVEMLKATFQGFEAKSCVALPTRIEALIRLLGVLSSGESMLDRSVWSIVQGLGLCDGRSSLKRQQIFSSKNHPNLSTTSYRHQLSECMRAVDVSSPFSNDEDQLFSATLLRRYIIALMDVIQFDLPNYISRIVAEVGDGALYVAVRSLLMRKQPKLGRSDENGNEYSNLASSLVRILSAMHEKQETQGQVSQHVHIQDKLRWMKATRDCVGIAIQLGPSRLRWFIEPAKHQPPQIFERFVFVGEADLAFEFAYIERVVQNSAPATTRDGLLSKALKAFYGKSEKTDQPSHYWVAVGINYRYTGALSLAPHDCTLLGDVLALPDLSSVVVGCQTSSPHTKGVVILRVFVKEKVCKSKERTADAFLQSIIQSPSARKNAAAQGALPFVRLCVLREANPTSSALSLDSRIILGQSTAHLAFEVLLEAMAGASIIMPPIVIHRVLALLVRNQIDQHYGTIYLRQLERVVTSTIGSESTCADIENFFNQAFSFDIESDPEDNLDVFDVFWLLAWQEAYPIEWKRCARTVLTQVYLLPGVLNDYRIWSYPVVISRDTLSLVDASNGAENPLLPGAVPTKLQYVAYFQHLLRLVLEVNSVGEAKALGSVRLSERLTRRESQEQIIVTSTLLRRFFIAVQNDDGVHDFLSCRNATTVLIEVLRGHRFSASLALEGLHCVQFISSICRDIRDEVGIEGLIDGLLEILWEIDDLVVGTGIVGALAQFQYHIASKRRMIKSLSRHVGSPRHENFSLPFTTTISSNGGSHHKQGKRIGLFILMQHTQTTPCACSNRGGSAHTTSNIVSHVARDFVSSVIMNAQQSPSKPRTMRTSQRFVTAATRFRKAVHIQHCVLRWLYINKRDKSLLFPSARSWNCANCSRLPSFLANTVMPIGQSEDLQSMLAYFFMLTADTGLCAILSQEFRLENSLLLLMSHQVASIRELALYTMANLCFRADRALVFVSSRLGKSLWDNRAFVSIWKMTDKVFCTWIEYATRSTFEKLSLTIPSGDGTSLSTIPSADDMLPDSILQQMDAVSTVLMAMSFSPSTTEVMLKIVTSISRIIFQVMSPRFPFLHLKLLTTVLNTLLLTESLERMDNFAVVLLKNLLTFSVDGDGPNDKAAQALIFGIAWVFCSWGSIRRAIVSECPEAVSRVLSFVIFGVSSDKMKRLDVLPMVSNAIGCVGAVLIDWKLPQTSAHLLDQLWELSVTLQDTSNSTNPAGSAETSTVNEDGYSISSATAVLPTWARRMRRYGLLPIGCVGAFTPTDLGKGIGDLLNAQIFRCFAIVAVSTRFDLTLRAKSARRYIHCLGHTVQCGGPGAHFALKTLPLVFKSANDASALSDSDINIVVRILGQLITSSASDIDGTRGHDLKLTRRAVIALWNIQASSSKAKQTSQQLLQELMNMLHLAQTEEKLRIAILGLVVLLIRQTQSREDPNDITSRQHGDACRAVVDEVPLIMGILSVYAAKSGTALIQPVKRWSPLFLDTDTSAYSRDSRVAAMEVLPNIRSPVELLHLLSDSVFGEKIDFQADWLGVFIKLLKSLDGLELRCTSASVLGRQEAVVQLTFILQRLHKRFVYSQELVADCFEILCQADVKMTYACDLSIIVIKLLKDPATNGVFHHPDHLTVLRTLRLVSSPGIRIELLDKCISILCAIAYHVTEEIFLKQCKCFSDECSRGLGVVFDAIVHLALGSTKGEICWSVVHNGLTLFRLMISWDNFRDAVMQKISGGSRAPLSDGRQPNWIRGMFVVAYQLSDFKYWLDHTPISSKMTRSNIVKSSMNSSFCVAQLLLTFQDDISTSSPALELAAIALVDELHHRLVPLRVKDPARAIIRVFVSIYRQASGPHWISDIDSADLREIRQASMQVLACIAQRHDARHSREMMAFVGDNYPNPVFLESDALVRRNLLRVYRLCSCCAAIYRIIRFGETPLWAARKVEDTGESFFRRLGQSFIIESDILVKVEVVLFLQHQHYSFQLISDEATRNDVGESATQYMLRSEAIGSDCFDAVEFSDDELLACIGNDLAVVPDSCTNLSLKAREFETGAYQALRIPFHPQGWLLRNTLIQSLLDHLALRSISITADQDSSIMLSICHHLLDIGILPHIKSASPEDEIVAPSTWSRLLKCASHFTLSLHELEEIYGLVKRILRKQNQTHKWMETGNALALRLGCKSFDLYGPQFCQLTMGIVEDLVYLADDIECVAAFISSKDLLKCLSQLLWIRDDDEHTALAASAVKTLNVLAKFTGPSHGKPVARAIDMCSAPLFVSNSHPVIVFGSGSAWWVLLQMLQGPSVSHLAKSDVLCLLLQLVLNEGEFVTDRLLTHGMIAALIDLLYHEQNAIRRDASKLLVKLARSGQSGRRVEAALGKITCLNFVAYYDGPLERLSHPLVDTVSSSRCADLQKIQDTLIRHPITIGLNVDDIMMLSNVLKLRKFPAGQVILTHPAAAEASLCIIASGVVDVAVESKHRRRHDRYVVKLAKGGLIGATSLVWYRDKIIEKVTARNDVVCLEFPESWLKDRHDGEPSPFHDLAVKVRIAVKRSMGFLDHVARGCVSSSCARSTLHCAYIQRLCDIVTGNHGQDPETLASATELLVLVCTFYINMIRSNTLSAMDSWVFAIVGPLIQHSELSVNLRRILCDVFFELVLSDEPGKYIEIAITLGHGEGLRGLIVLGRSSTYCSSDELCLWKWVRVMCAMLSHDPGYAQTVSHVVSKGSLLRLASLCVRNVKGDSNGLPLGIVLDVWHFLSFVSQQKGLIKTLMGALISEERSAFAEGMLHGLALTRTSLLSKLLSSCSESTMFLTALWQLSCVQGSGIVDHLKGVSVQLHDILHWLQFCIKTIRYRNIFLTAKASLLKWIDSVLADDVLLAWIAVDSCYSIAVACQFMKCLRWVSKCLIEDDDRVVIKSLLQRCVLSWRVGIERCFTGLDGRTRKSRREINLYLAGLRIIYESSHTYDDSNGDTSVYQILRGITADYLPAKSFRYGARASSTFTACSLISSMSSVSSTKASEDILDFFMENSNWWDSLGNGSASRRLLRSELLMLRVKIKRSNVGNYICSSHNNHPLLGWLLPFLWLDKGARKAAIIRVAAQCVSLLLTQDPHSVDFAISHAPQNVKCVIESLPTNGAISSRIRVLSTLFKRSDTSLNEKMFQAQESGEWLDILRNLMQLQHVNSVETIHGFAVVIERILSVQSLSSTVAASDLVPVALKFAVLVAQGTEVEIVIDGILVLVSLLLVASDHIRCDFTRQVLEAIIIWLRHSLACDFNCENSLQKVCLDALKRLYADPKYTEEVSSCFRRHPLLLLEFEPIFLSLWIKPMKFRQLVFTLVGMIVRSLECQEKCIVQQWLHLEDKRICWMNLTSWNSNPEDRVLIAGLLELICENNTNIARDYAVPDGVVFGWLCQNLQKLAETKVKCWDANSVLLLRMISKILQILVIVDTEDVTRLSPNRVVLSRDIVKSIDQVFDSCHCSGCFDSADGSPLLRDAILQALALLGTCLKYQLGSTRAVCRSRDTTKKAFAVLSWVVSRDKTVVSRCSDLISRLCYCHRDIVRQGFPEVHGLPIITALMDTLLITKKRSGLLQLIAAVNAVINASPREAILCGLGNISGFVSYQMFLLSLLRYDTLVNAKPLLVADLVAFGLQLSSNDAVTLHAISFIRQELQSISSLLSQESQWDDRSTYCQIQKVCSYLQIAANALQFLPSMQSDFNSSNGVMWEPVMLLLPRSKSASAISMLLKVCVKFLEYSPLSRVGFQTLNAPPFSICERLVTVLPLSIHSIDFIKLTLTMCRYCDQSALIRCQSVVEAAFPHVTQAAITAINRNNCDLGEVLLALIAEILIVGIQGKWQWQWRSLHSASSCTPVPWSQLLNTLVRAMRARRNYCLPTQAALCSFLVTQAEDLGTPYGRECREMGYAIMKLLRDIIEKLVTASSEVLVSSTSQARKFISDFGVSHSSRALLNDIPRLFPLNWMKLSSDVIAVWVVLRILEDLCNIQNIGEVLAAYVRLSDAQRLLTLSTLPTDVYIVQLRLMSTWLRHFGLQKSLAVDDVSLASVLILVPNPNSQVSAAAVRAWWNLIRNALVRIDFVALILRSSLVTEQIDDLEANTALAALQYVKETVCTSELDVAGMEASFGVLAQLAKHEDMHTVLTSSADLTINPPAEGSGKSILAVISAAKIPSVLRQQCKFFQRLSSRAVTIRHLSSNRNVLDALKCGLALEDPNIWRAVGDIIRNLLLVTEFDVSSHENIKWLLDTDDSFALRAIHSIIFKSLQAHRAEPRTATYVYVINIYCEVLDVITSSASIIHRTSAIASVITEMPKTLLLVLIGVDADGDGCVFPIVNRYRLLRIIRRLSKYRSIIRVFRCHSVSNTSEPFNMLIGFLNNFSDSPNPDRPDTIIHLAFQILQNITQDPVVCGMVVARVEVLESLLRYWHPLSSIITLNDIWQVLRRVTENADGVFDLMEQISSPSRIGVLVQLAWANDEPHAALVLAIATTLRQIGQKSTSAHHLLIHYLPVYKILLSSGNAIVTAEALINIGQGIALVAHTAEKNHNAFRDVLDVIEAILMMCDPFVDCTISMKSPYASRDFIGMKKTVEQLVSALCSLLILFHEKESHYSLFPGYTVVLTRSPRSFKVQCKRTGVFYRGYSPPTFEILDQILRIYALAFRFQEASSLSDQPRSRSDILSVQSHCMIYVTHFFAQAVETPSGRFMFLSTRVVAFWATLLPQMDLFSLQRLRDTLIVCTLSSIHTRAFLTSGALKLLIASTVRSVQRATSDINGSSRRTSARKQLADNAFLQFLVGVAVLSERGQFLQSTYYLMYNGANNGVTMLGLVFGAILHADGCASYMSLACQVVSRIFKVLTLKEAQAFLSSCPLQLQRTFGWYVTEEDMSRVLVTMLVETEKEALLKSRVLTRVIHSSLLRAAILGLVDKGIPEVLHDFGLMRISSSMKALLKRCKNIDRSCTSKWGALLHDTSLLRKTNHEKTSTGPQLAVTEGALSEDNPNDQLNKCIQALRDVIGEIGEYALVNYKSVFRSFESMNDDVELIAALGSVRDAVTLVQATHYALPVFHEAVIASLLANRPGVSLDQVDSNVTSANERCRELLRTADLVLQKTEKVVEWIAISLQHGDVDLIYYSRQFQLMEQLAGMLLQLPLALNDDDEDPEATMYEDSSLPASDQINMCLTQRIQTQRTSLSAFRRQTKSEDGQVYVRFLSLELHSWLWSVLGFLPYLRVRYRNDSQIIRFRTKQTPKDRHKGYACTFKALTCDDDHVVTSYRDLPHTVNVEVWMYIPFWYQDVLLSHTKVPIFARSVGLDEIEVPFFPESSRGVRANHADILGTLSLQISDRRSLVVPTAYMTTIRDEFPAYSTLGSRPMRRILSKGANRVWQSLTSGVSNFADAIHADKLLPASLIARRRLTIFEPRSDEKGNSEQMTVKQSVEFLIRKMYGIAREATHPDKLIGTYEKHIIAQRCETLMNEIDPLIEDFVATLVEAFEASNNHVVWEEAAEALSVIKLSFLGVNHRYLSSYNEQQPVKEERPGFRKHSAVPAEDQEGRDKKEIALLAKREHAQHLHQKPFCEVSSQLRNFQFQLEHEELGPRTFSSARLLRKGFALPGNSFQLLETLKRRRLLSGRQIERRPEPPAISTRHTSHRLEWRMVYPHVSVWSLCRARLPAWHSFSRMAAPTSLNHFLIQPMERLQVYAITLQYLEATMKQSHAKPGASPLNSVVNKPTAKIARVATVSGRCSTTSVGDETTQSAPSVATIEDEGYDDKTPETRGPTLSPSKTKRDVRSLAFWKARLCMSDRSAFSIVPHALLPTAPILDDLQELESIRARRLLKYHALDPFDAAARVKRLYYDAQNIPAVLYREGRVAKTLNWILWILLALTLWRFSIAWDAVRDSARSFREIYNSQSNEEDLVELRKMARTQQTVGGGSDDLRIVVSDGYLHRSRQHLSHKAPATEDIRKHQVAPSPSQMTQLQETNLVHHFILVSARELRHVVILLEMKHLFIDVFHVWPQENGNLGLNGFWSSLLFTAVAITSPIVCLYGIFPWLLKSSVSASMLSKIACAYGASWIFMALVSILGIARKIPAFRDVRRVDRINLTSFPSCVRNYMAIGSIIWEGFQLNTTSFSVWKMSYKPKQLAALTTIDLQDLGLGFFQVDLFRTKQALSLVCLVLWCFCLKASNKFKSTQWLNYAFTFLLPNLLGGMLFMFLSKQFYLSTACFENEAGETVLWSNSEMHCWTSEHMTYALRGMFGMSVFVPLAVLAYGSYQVFFPEVNLDVQTSPVLNVSAQIVKAAMMGALTFFARQVRLFLGVALAGNVLLLFLVLRFELCSTWHLKYSKVLIYAISSWSALCALLSTFLSEADRDSIPLYTMHAGWALQTLVYFYAVRRRRQQHRAQLKSGLIVTRHVQSRLRPVEREVVNH